MRAGELGRLVNETVTGRPCCAILGPKFLFGEQSSVTLLENHECGD